MDPDVFFPFHSGYHGLGNRSYSHLDGVPVFDQLQDILPDSLVAVAWNSPVQYGNGLPVYILFDEIQYLRDWEIHLKALVDTFREIKFIVSGSAAAALKLKSRESGAGRFTDFLLPPLTFYEYLALLDKLDIMIAPPEVPRSNIQGLRFYDTHDINELNKLFVHYLNYGGYPEVILS
ncbi:MAG: AAA family ATPase, partial [Syntrophobacteraceae bacterium]